MLLNGFPHLTRIRNAPPAAAPDALRKSFWNGVIDEVIYIVAIFAPLVLIPQAIAVYASRDAHGLSLTTWTLLVLVNVLWVLYARVHRETPVLISSVLSGSIELVIVIGIFLYR